MSVAHKRQKTELDEPGTSSTGLEDESEKPFDSKKPKIHSLDSDEEDEHEIEKEKYNVMDAEAQMFDGQEQKTIDYDGDIKITAFNMEDEMEDGHFDKEGTFIFKKEKEVIQDSWLENIDWVKVKEGEEKKSKEPKGLADSDSSDGEDEVKPISRSDIKVFYEKMLVHMKPTETVLKCIKRLGGGPVKNRRDKKKLDAEQQKILDDMVGYANDVLSTGDMDIYQRTYEQLKFVLSHKKVEASDMDMFADADEDVKPGANGDNKKDEAGPSEEKDNFDEKVTWEYKWEDKEGSQIYGPYSSEDMLAWTEEGYFKTGVFVRKKNEEKFYSSKRIDFDLYC